MKNELIQNITEVVYCPQTELVKMDIDWKRTKKFPIEQAMTLGVAFKPLVQLASFAQGEGGKSGLYFVNTYGKKMFKSGGKFIGNLQTDNGRVGGGIARLTQLPLDPTMMCMAVALMTVERKLDAIQEAQKEIIEFLELKEEAKLKGNFNALSDVLDNYKYNWDNEKYKNNKHILVQDIKRDAEQSIILHRERLGKQLRKNTLIYNNKTVKNMFDDMVARLTDYQLALYTFAFSSFLEVMLLENFESDYLNAVSDKIVQYVADFDECYRLCAEKIKSISESSIEGFALKGLSTISSGAGKLVEKIPGINRSQLDENLIKMGDKLRDSHSGRVENLTQLLTDSQKYYVSVFIQNIKTINTLYNKPVQLMFDEQNIYILEE